MKTNITLPSVLCIFFTFFIVASSKAQQATEVTAQDTRHNITTPSTYTKSLQLHFKYHSSMSGLDGMYFPVIGIRGWTEDNSGGKAHELTFSDDNQMYVRSGFSPSWEGWRRILSENYSGNVGIGTKSPDQKLTIKGGGIGFDGNSADKKLYSPADGVLEWMTNELAGERAFAVSHQGTKRIYLNALGNSYLMGGNVGIGTMAPTTKLDVNGNLKVLSGTNPIFFTSAWTGTPDQVTHTSEISNDVGNYKRLMIVGNKSAGGDRRVGIWDGLDIAGAGFHQTLNVNGGTYISGNVGIGISNPQVKLAVNGDILSKKIKVTQTGWPDYVFEPTYKLPTINEVEAFIKQHQHLPDVPSVKEVNKNGLDLGDNQAVLLKKIEEQMLYIIELNKQLQEQQKTIEYLKQRIDKS